MNLTVILLSNLKSGDYLFINNSYLKKNRLVTYDDQK